MLLVAAEIQAPPELASPFPDVANDAQWYAFVAAMTVQGVTDTAPSGGLGMFALQPRRLAELGLMDPASVRRERRPDGGWRELGAFVAPWSGGFYLDEQREALGRSAVAYQRDIAAARIRVPHGVSLAGALAILHRGRLGALQAFPRLLSDTRELYDRSKGCFP